MTEESSGFKERRKFARANVYAVVRYICPISGIDIELRTPISDISEGGVQLTSVKKIPEGAPVKISFVTPGAQNLYTTAEGITRHTETISPNAFRIGIKFVGLKENERVAIRNYVASHIKK